MIESLEHKGFKIEIHQDEWGESPREWDNLGTMVIFHPRYNLGDKHSFRSAEDAIEFMNNAQDDIYWLPVYMYEHSGITISTTPFGCRWDSGQVGFIYVTKEHADKEGVIDALAVLEGEIENLDQYIRGENYGYKVIDGEGTEVDSCWGFLGDMDYCVSEAKAVVDYYDKQKQVA